MKHRISVLLALIVTFTAMQAQDAAKLLDSCAAKLSGAKSVTAAYQLTADGGTTSGTLTMAGNRYHNATAELTVWFDGKTQWAYAPSTGEVNIIEPTPEELAQTNPLAIINALRRNFKCAYAKAPAGLKTVKMTPLKRGSDIAEATVTINPSTQMPTAITARMTDGQQLRIAIKSIKTGGSLPASTFTFNHIKYPGAVINDLR